MDPDPASFSALLFVDWSSSLVFDIICLCLLLAASGLISGAEVAFFSLTNTEIEEEKESGSKRMHIATKLLSNPKKLLATILISNNFVNIAIVLLFESISSVFLKNAGQTLIFIIKVVLATALILLFGEILPKIYASRNKVRFATFMAYPVNILYKLLSPISTPMRGFTLFIQERMGRKKSNLSVDHLSHALELASEEDTTQEEKKILKGIVSFGNTDTKQVMIPRIDIFALGENLTFKDIMPEILSHGYSRIPIYKDNMDVVTGVLYVKDLLPHIDKKNFAWASLIREPYFVPENKKLDDLLREFQEKKNHLAIVVDEYGGTSGLVTLEDIIEEIVGDISDEFDDDDIMYSKIDDRNYVFEGKTNLKDFYRVVSVEDEDVFEDHKGESETLAGFVLELSGSFPKKGDKISFENYAFTVEVLDKKRIKQIKVTVVR